MTVLMDMVGGLLEGVEWLTRSVTDARSAVIAGTIAGLLAVAFTLGGAAALRGRPSLQTPACRRCGSRLRGVGLEPPDTCPECGASLHDPRSVRWVRFRRQPLTLAITAPVTLVGGSLLAIAASLWIMSMGADFLLRPPRPTPRSVARALSGVAIAPPQTGQATSIVVADDDANETGAEDETQVETRPHERVVAAIADSRSSLRRTIASGVDITELVPLLRLLEREGPLEPRTVDALRAFAQEVIEGHGLMMSGNDGPLAVTGAMLIQPLVRHLLDRGEIDEAWIAARLETANASKECVLPPVVAPGGWVGVRIIGANDLSTRSRSWVLTITVDGEQAYSTQSADPRIGWVSWAGFPVPDAPGDHRVSVLWVEPRLVWRPATRDFVEDTVQREATSTIAVRAGPETLPRVSDDASDPFINRSARLTIFVTSCGARDSVRLDWRNVSRVLLAGTFSLRVGDEWHVIADTRTTAGHQFSQRLLRRPAEGWPDRLEVRFEPHSDPAASVLPQMPPSVPTQLRGHWAGLLRSVDRVWAGAREFTLTPSSDPSESGYWVWPP